MNRSPVSTAKATAVKLLPPAVRRRLRGAAEGVYAVGMNITLRVPSAKIRATLLRNLFRMRIDATARVYSLEEVRHAHRITIGRNTIVGSSCSLDGRRGIYIGENVNFSTGAAIWTLQHDLQSPDFGLEGGPVRVEDRAWVSTRAIILPNVTIGEGAVVAAGAVVSKSVDPWTIVGGVPARKIGDRRPSSYNFDAHGTAAWFI